MFLVILIALIVIAVGYWFHRYNTSWKYINKIRGPKGLPLIGNALDVGRTPYGECLCFVRYQWSDSMVVGKERERDVR